MPGRRHRSPWAICLPVPNWKYPPATGLNIDSDFCFEDFAERVARQVERLSRIERLLQIASCPFTGPQAEVSPTPVHSSALPSPAMKLSTSPTPRTCMPRTSR